MKPILILLLTYLTTDFVHSNNEPKKCKLRDYGNDKKVCVCNDSYCDTIPRPEKVDCCQYLLYTSSKQGLRFHKTIGQFRSQQDAEEIRHKINIDRHRKYQTIIGWGGAFTDSTGLNIQYLNTSAQKFLMESYFSEYGIEYNIARVPIGGTDFSRDYYTYDDLGENEEDLNLEKFNLQEADYKYKIPLMQEALQLRKNHLRFLGSPWGAPKWMKTNNQIYGGGFIKRQLYQIWANYVVKFLEAYHQNGLKFWAVTTQNEPILVNILVNPFPAVGWTSANMAKWIGNNLGPTLRNSSFFNTKIIILDDLKIGLPWFVDAVLANKTVHKMVSGIAIHWYFDVLSLPDALNLTHDRYPELFILSTEACSGYKGFHKGVLLGSWERGEDYTSDIMKDLHSWVVGWIDWNMALNLEGGPNLFNNFVDSPIVVNASAGEFYKQPMYYHFGHHAKFVPEDSVRIEAATSFNNLLTVTAFLRPDDAVVVVILNKNEKDIPVQIFDQTLGVAVVIIKKRSINTLLYWYDDFKPQCKCK